MDKELPAMQEMWVRKIPWSRKWQPTAVFLPGKSHGQRRLTSYSLWGHKELDMAEQLSTCTHTHTHTHTHTQYLAYYKHSIIMFN